MSVRQASAYYPEGGLLLKNNIGWWIGLYPE